MVEEKWTPCSPLTLTWGAEDRRVRMCGDGRAECRQEAERQSVGGGLRCPLGLTHRCFYELLSYYK
jgi:hypothetical protein